MMKVVVMEKLLLMFCMEYGFGEGKSFFVI